MSPRSAIVSQTLVGGLNALSDPNMESFFPTSISTNALFWAFVKWNFQPLPLGPIEGARFFPNPYKFEFNEPGIVLLQIL